MRRSWKTALAVWFVSSAVVFAQETLQPSQPEKEHEWLQQLAGEWDTHGKAETPPGQPPFECFGTETIRGIGGLWIVAEGEAHAMGMTVTSQLTLGYDPVQKKFIGTWIDSMINHMWRYEGTLDETGTRLTLLTEGPNVMVPGATAKYKEILELKSKDEKRFTSYMQAEGGEWVKLMTATAKRKK